MMSKSGGGEPKGESKAIDVSFVGSGAFKEGFSKAGLGQGQRLGGSLCHKANWPLSSQQIKTTSEFRKAASAGVDVWEHA
jgi:hypothetical protein